MNNKLPFEQAFEERMQDLPLPDENGAWEKMDALLDKQDRPGSFLSGYKLWGVILVLLLTGAGIFYVNQSTSLSQENSTAPKTLATNKQLQVSPDVVASYTVNSSMTQSGSLSTPSISSSGYATNPVVPEKLPAKSTSAIDVSDKNQRDITTKSVAVANSSSLVRNTSALARDGATSKVSSSKAKTYASPNGKATLIGSSKSRRSIITKGHKVGIPVNDNSKVTGDHSTLEDEDITIRDLDFDLAEVKAAIKAFKANGTPIPDLLAKRGALLSLAKENKAAPPQKLRKTLIVSAGVGLHQKLPVGGQNNQYGYNAKSKVADYIPSLYLRVEKANKWYFQTEFIYGAPQLLHSFAFNRKTQVNAAEGSITTTSMNISKTFYSEIPFTFNYFLYNNWSFGVGGSYSWLLGAIAERTTKVSNLFGQQQSLNTQVVPIKGYTDSFLYNSHVNLLVQTDYQWKQLSFGLRYSRDMQPYIKYTLPDGQVEERRNWSLEFILRLRLWRSLKF